jgi:hypothetical protein
LQKARKADPWRADGPLIAGRRRRCGVLGLRGYSSRTHRSPNRSATLTEMKKHIRLLEGAELVTREKTGCARTCTLVPCAFEGISTWLQRLDRFAQVVERTKGAR